MTPDDIKKAEEILGHDTLRQVDDEQTVAVEGLIAIIEGIDITTRVDWLYNRSWEDALVPMRLPKGTSELLKTLDEAKVDMTDSLQCDKCKKRPDCLLLKRNPSEILLTGALKLAIARTDLELKGRE